ncbi:archaeosortase/exosortase family protein [Thermococcus sp. AM4]|uniref:archaeosortase/exosortase family protein n=1 Tax=Thermococcus sp. (strain AM4) TaxID=246969 RepID=UPI0013050E8D|nr:archaeosortase/exosortase family protein [Thermococcus sp. AM4]
MSPKQFTRTIILLLIGAVGLSVLFKPIENYLITLVARVAFLILTPVKGVSLVDGTIYGNGISVEVVYLCTPAPVFGLVVAYFALTWRGLKDLILLPVSFLIMALFDGLRIAVMFVLLEHNCSMFIAHDVTAYASFLAAIGFILFIREKT